MFKGAKGVMAPLIFLKLIFLYIFKFLKIFKLYNVFIKNQGKLS